MINVGVVNIVLIKDDKWIGYNIDGIGYVKGLYSVYLDLENVYILILGVGGVSKGIVYELVKFVKFKLIVVNRMMVCFEFWNLNIN